MQTKLFVPRIRSTLVTRPHLSTRLAKGMGKANTGFSRKLTLVSAPAGFGKSTLVASWLAGVMAHDATAKLPASKQPDPGWQHTWLSLDEQDNAPVRFLAYLVAALQQVRTNWGQALSAMLQAPQLPPLATLLGSLVNEISQDGQQSAPVILVLDDYHLIHEAFIHEALAWFVEHLPPQLHLVLITREDPPLPLARLRAGALLSEIRMNDLRFSREETAVFLTDIMGLQLVESDINALEKRTEGWIAGLHMAALTLQNNPDAQRFIRSFTGSSRYVLDYLIEEVFQQQSPEMQRFLLETAILPRFNAGLCDAVTGRADSQQQIMRLEQANLFLISLDEERNWFRYHHLFAGLLRHRLQLADIDRTELRRRAGRWLQNKELSAEAIPHFLAAAAWSEAASLIMAICERLFRRGEAITLLGWIKQLPADFLQQQPALEMQQAWALILTGELDAADALLARLSRQAQHMPAFLGDVLAAQAHLARARYDAPATITLSQQALALLGPEEETQRSVLTVNLGIAYWTTGQVAEAEQALTSARKAAQRSRNHYAHAMSVGFLGLVLGTQGKLPQAAAMLRQTIAQAPAHPTSALMHRVLSAVCAEWNDLETADRHLQQALGLARAIGNVELQTGVLRGWALLQQQQGDGAGALAKLAELEQVTTAHQMPAFTRSCNAAAHVQIALAQNDLATAVHWAGMISEPADASPFFPRLRLTTARILLAQGEREAAAKALAALHRQALEAGWQWGLIEVCLLSALAAEDRQTAVSFLCEALAIAEPVGFVRTFVDKGAPLAALLRTVTEMQGAPAYAEKLLPHFARSAIGIPEASASRATRLKLAQLGQEPKVSQLIEPLSERELEIVTLLAAGQTNAEIAQTLFVSVNTVKTHLRHIYEKLTVHNRRAAVAKAREYQLLSGNKS